MTTSLFMRALNGSNKGRPPVWLMRQAGRYMPAYRQLRQRYSFLELCQNPELIVTTTLLPIQQLGVDAAILFADILLLAQPLGLNLQYEEAQGPLIDPPIHTAADIARLPNDPTVVTEAFSGTVEAIEILKNTLKVPLIGFAAAPFTLASYLIEGRTSRDFKRTKQWLMRDPKSFHLLLQRLTEYTRAYLQLQIDAGVDAIQLFDSWAHILTPTHFSSCCTYYLRQLQQSLPSHIPLIFFCRGTHAYLPQIAAANPSAVSLDWTCDLRQARTTMPSIALQGNLDPSWLYAPLQDLTNATQTILDTMAGDPSFIFNLGHGIPPDVTVEAVRQVVTTVQQSSYAIPL